LSLALFWRLELAQTTITKLFVSEVSSRVLDS
jgi:hypothetical protein